MNSHPDPISPTASDIPSLPPVPSPANPLTLPDLPIRLADPNYLDPDCILYCDHCNYNLNGLSIAGNNVDGKPCFQCPECGHLQPASTPRKKPPTAIQRWTWVSLKVLAAITLGIAVITWGMQSVASVMEIYADGIGIGGHGVYYKPKPLAANDMITTAILGLSLGWLGRGWIFRSFRGLLPALILGASAVLLMGFSGWALLLKVRAFSGTTTMTSSGGIYSESLVLQTSAWDKNFILHLLIIFLATLLGAIALCPLAAAIWNHLIRPLRRKPRPIVP